MSERTYDWMHKDIPISMSHLSDKQMASEIRMLSRNDLCHEPIIQGARDRIMCLVKEKDKLEKEKARLRSKSRLALSIIKDSQYAHRDNQQKCMFCNSLKGYAHHTYCQYSDVVNALENECGGTIEEASEFIRGEHSE